MFVRTAGRGPQVSQLSGREPPVSVLSGRALLRLHMVVVTSLFRNLKAPGFAPRQGSAFGHRYRIRITGVRVTYSPSHGTMDDVSGLSQFSLTRYDRNLIEIEIRLRVTVTQPFLLNDCV